MCLINRVLFAPGTHEYRAVLTVLYVSAILTQYNVFPRVVHKTYVNHKSTVLRENVP